MSMEQPHIDECCDNLADHIMAVGDLNTILEFPVGL